MSSRSLRKVQVLDAGHKSRCPCEHGKGMRVDMVEYWQCPFRLLSAPLRSTDTTHERAPYAETP